MTRQLSIAITAAVGLALALTACGTSTPMAVGSGQTSGRVAPAANSPAAPTSAFALCPESPPDGAPPSPLPARDDVLKLATDPCYARYEGVADVRGLTTFDLTIGRLAPGEAYFAPTLLRGTSGESLHLHIVNTTPVLHNFSISAQGIDTDVPAGGSVDLVVTFAMSGPIVYICRYHAEELQAGELFTISG